LSLGHPVVPNIKGREHIITSDDAFFLEKLPKKVTIVGMNLFYSSYAFVSRKMFDI
jgi:glutathione reductase (NADPH)